MCLFLLYNKVNQLCVCVCVCVYLLPLEFPFYPYSPLPLFLTQGKKRNLENSLWTLVMD